MNVYVIRAKEGMCKIGIAVDPNERVKALSTGSPFPLSVVEIFRVEASLARSIERVAHHLLASKRLNGEWFDVEPDEAATAIRQAIESPHLLIEAHGLEPKSNARRQREFRMRQTARANRVEMALRQIVVELEGNNKPLAVEIRDIATAALT